MRGKRPTKVVHTGTSRSIALLVFALGALGPFTWSAHAASAHARARSAHPEARAAPAHAHTAPAPTCTGVSLQPTATNLATIESATMCLIDRVRVAHGLHTLNANRELQVVAAAQVQSMVQLDYFADNRPSGATPMALILATGYGRHARSVSAGENIGWGTQSLSTPAQLVAGWMHSPPHREIILTGEYEDAGVGVIAAAPARLADGQAGATYALELAGC